MEQSGTWDPRFRIIHVPHYLSFPRIPLEEKKKKIAENKKQSSAEAGRELARLIARPKVEVVSLVHQGHRGLVQTVAA